MDAEGDGTRCGGRRTVTPHLILLREEQPAASTSGFKLSKRPAMKARVMFKWENEAVRNVIADVEIYVGEKLSVSL